MIYLDNAATTLKKPPCVAEAVVRAMATLGNSGRTAHLDASRVIYRTREQLARLLGCSAAERVVFTCNSTEALNIAIDGLFAPGDHVLSTDCEHNSVLRPLYRLEGVEVDRLLSIGQPQQPPRDRPPRGGGSPLSKGYPWLQPDGESAGYPNHRSLRQGARPAAGGGRLPDGGGVRH